MTTIILTVFAIISALIHTWAEKQGPAILIYIFKPLTMVFIILISLLAKKPPTSRYKYAIIAGLLFSLVGDIFLLLPVDLFMAGLISFLIVHMINTHHPYMISISHSQQESRPRQFAGPFAKADSEPTDISVNVRDYLRN